MTRTITKIELRKHIARKAGCGLKTIKKKSEDCAIGNRLPTQSPSRCTRAPPSRRPVKYRHKHDYTVAPGQVKEKTRKPRTVSITQQDIETRCPSVDNENHLRGDAGGEGIHEIGPSAVVNHRCEAASSERLDRMGFVFSGLARNSIPMEKSYPSIIPVTETPKLPETQKQTTLQRDPHHRNDPSKQLTAHHHTHQEDVTGVTATPLAAEKHFRKKVATKAKLFVDHQFSTTVSAKYFQRELLLLSHASSCKQGRRCRVNTSCAQLNSLWKHISSCKQRECEICESPNYTKYKNILNHYQNCKNARCGYCAPVRETVSDPCVWHSKHRQVQIKKLLQTASRTESCQPETPMESPTGQPAKERTIKFATASTRLLNRYSEHEQRPPILARESEQMCDRDHDYDYDYNYDYDIEC